MPRRSIRRRLILAAAIWIALGVGLAGLVLSAVFHTHLDAQVREELAVHLDELQGLTVIEEGGRPKLTRPLSDPRYDQKLSGYYWEIVNGGDIVSRSASLSQGSIVTPADTVEDGKLHFHEITGPTGELLLAEKIYRRPDGQLKFLISTDKRHIASVMGAFNTTLGSAMAAFGIAMTLAASLLIAHALRPLALLRDELTRIRGGAAKRLGSQHPEEVLPLVQDLNAMIEASSNSLEKARAQAGNIAHGLKTPLAVLTDEAHALERSGHGKSAATILEQSLRMQRHIDYQLARARAAGNRTVPGTIMAVKPAIETVVSALTRLHRARNIRVDHNIDSALRVACDSRDFNEIIANLIDNACKHAATRVSIVSEPAPRDGQVFIVVEDDGPGLPPEARDVVFNIGERWDSQAQGTGLGLPIARDLAQLYGGSIELQSSALGGLRALLLMPGDHHNSQSSRGRLE